MPDWAGDPPLPTPIEIVSTRGCDIAPLDATDPAVEARLSAYVWAEARARMARLRGGIAMMRERGVDLVAADAADWVEAQLAVPQAAGTTRVLMHSVVWQYLPDETAERIRTAMLAAAARADDMRPLAWVAMEPDRALAHQVIRVRSWPGHGDWHVVGTAHAHGAWIRRGPIDPAHDGIVLPDTAKVTL